MSSESVGIGGEFGPALSCESRGDSGRGRLKGRLVVFKFRACSSKRKSLCVELGRPVVLRNSQICSFDHNLVLCDEVRY